MSAVLKQAITVAAQPVEFKQISFDYDASQQVLWGYMNPANIPNFNITMLREMREFDATFESNNWQVVHEGALAPVSFYVAASKSPGIFNLGGDLGLFLTLIKAKDREALSYYAHLCVNNIVPRALNYNSRHLTTIALVQGDALGGGFELVLANDIIVAERGATMGFPEILFNLFPGMGALSLLGRRVGLHKARQMVSSGDMYKAEDLAAMGVVDVLAEPGQGENAIRDYIRRHDRNWNGLRAIGSACRRIEPIVASEISDIADLWVDAALSIKDNDLRMMERFVKGQRKRLGLGDGAAVPLQAV